MARANSRGLLVNFLHHGKVKLKNIAEKSVIRYDNIYINAVAYFPAHL